MNDKRFSMKFLPFLLTACLLLAGCGSSSTGAKNVKNAAAASQTQTTEKSDSGSDSSTASGTDSTKTQSVSHPADYFPDYSGNPYSVINNNIPEFSESDLTTKSYESYGELDSLGRCTSCIASIGKDLMPSEKRGSIGMIRPTGWHTVKYDWIDGKYLYNRCHLIGYQLTAENANRKNLITGTRYLNIEGMLPFENMTADYIEETGNHVLYRVTPVFSGDNLVASGVHMEAQSVEDQGEGVMFNIYCYNIQGGVSIDYATGESHAAEQTSSTDTDSSDTGSSDTGSAATAAPADADSSSTAAAETADGSGTASSAGTGTAESTYIINTSTGKFHTPGCSSVRLMNEENKQEISSTYDTLISEGYDPCKNCLS